MRREALVVLAVAVSALAASCSAETSSTTTVSTSRFTLVRSPAPSQPGDWFAVGFVSADGTTVMGDLVRPSGYRSDIFRWTRASGLSTLPFPPGFPTAGNDVTATLTGIARDGDVVTGFSFNADLDGNQPTLMRAFRWTAAGGTQDLGAPLDQAPAFASVIVSEDGQTVAGSTGGRAFRWTPAEGLRDLGVLPGDERSLPVGVSAQGDTVVVVSGTDAARPLSVRGWRLASWTAASGLRPLDLPPGMTFCDSRPGLTSADGSVVVGRCAADTFGVPSALFRWTVDGPTQLGQMPSKSAPEPRFMTVDGRIVTGNIQGTQPGGTSTAFRWTETADLVVAREEDPTAGPVSPLVTLATSADGSALVGLSGVLPAHWSAGGPVELLSLPPGYADGRLLAVSADGARAAGEVSGPPPPDGSRRPTAAIVWDRAAGLRLVSDVLTERGVDLQGAALSTAVISNDGATLAGSATFSDGSTALWIATP